MSAVNSIYHIVINTYRREMTIPDETSEHMYRYIWSIINRAKMKIFYCIWLSFKIDLA